MLASGDDRLQASYNRCSPYFLPSPSFLLLTSPLFSSKASYNRCIDGLVRFRKLHFELAYTYVRQWDTRPDEEIKGTGGTPFMPYLKKHRRTTFETLVPTGDETEARAIN